ncbi:hypothetical protein ACN42_g4582 [Penicillium freii]|uniref:Uncharacterized protein n=1 Tax=Penicillium freii TaxID=48697 RepID=A0A117NPJ6_PENFR|nr:hypothetical protein ACN42_g4582 [Penicillium freii]
MSPPNHSPNSQYIDNHRSSSTCTLVTPVPRDCPSLGNLGASTSPSIHQRNNQVRYSFRAGPFSQMSFSTRSVLTRPHHWTTLWRDVFMGSDHMLHIPFVTDVIGSSSHPVIWGSLLEISFMYLVRKKNQSKSAQYLCREACYNCRCTLRLHVCLVYSGIDLSQLVICKWVGRT